MGTGFQFGRMESSGDGWWGRLHANAISALTGTLKVEMVNFMLHVFCQSRTERRQNKPKPEEPLREAGSVCAGSPAGACPRHMGRLWPGCTTGHPASSQLPPRKPGACPSHRDNSPTAPIAQGYNSLVGPNTILRRVGPRQVSHSPGLCRSGGGSQPPLPLPREVL